MDDFARPQLSLVHLLQMPFLQWVIIHFGMLSWLTSKKYIRVTARSKRAAEKVKVWEINSVQQPLVRYSEAI